MRALYATLMGQHKLRMSEPLEIIAYRSDKDFSQAAPLRNGGPITDPAFVPPGDDRVFIVLNLFDPDSWRGAEVAENGRARCKKPRNATPLGPGHHRRGHHGRGYLARNFSEFMTRTASGGMDVAQGATARKENRRPSLQ